MESTATGSTSVLDRYLPEYHFREIHSRRIQTSTARVKEALMAFTPSDTPLSGFLMALRLAPAALVAHSRPLSPQSPWMELLLKFGFVELGQTDEEVALGAVGQFGEFVSGSSRLQTRTHSRCSISRGLQRER